MLRPRCVQAKTFDNDLVHSKTYLKLNVDFVSVKKVCCAIQDRVERLNTDITRLQQHAAAALNSGSDRTVASCLREVVSISAELQQSSQVLLVDFDVQFFIAAKQKNVRRRLLKSYSEHNDTL